ncbi:hypothetical protein H5410_039148 [Solanum commersonii]|uniref:Uncharacterized protein n=1 Tax=Solanum commersonii TaxID=4109 RepID=A0A9J5YF85_SOLCO|nr:hypothetical protein H5410_039148 [Solanum commersonii]
MKLQIQESILSTLKGIHFLKFKPSVIAAAVAISFAVKTETVVDTSDFVKVPIASSIQFVPQSPIGVLDATCLSYRTDGSVVESRSNSSHSSEEKAKYLEMDG